MDRWREIDRQFIKAYENINEEKQQNYFAGLEIVNNNRKNV